jgi:hypothetical protein
MKSVKVYTNETAELLRLIAEDYLVNNESISSAATRIAGEQATEAFSFFYDESHLERDKYLLVDSNGVYSYLGQEGIILFLLFLAEYEENP